MKTEESKRKHINYLENKYPEIIKLKGDLIEEYDSKKYENQIIKKDLWFELVKRYKSDNIDLPTWMSYLGLTKPIKPSSTNSNIATLDIIMRNPEYEWVEHDQLDWPAVQWVKK